MTSPILMDSVTFKVLVVGSFGIGKTTLIQQISDVPVVGTEVATSGGEAEIKPTTTVGVEYGLFSVGDGDAMVTLLLFGTPGQDRFDAARDVAARGIDGLVVIVDGEEPESWAAGRGLYRSYNPDRDLPTVVVVNRLVEEAPLPTGLEVALEVESERSVFCCGNVVDAADAKRFLVELLTLILVSESDQEMELAP